MKPSENTANTGVYSELQKVQRILHNVRQMGVVELSVEFPCIGEYIAALEERVIELEAITEPKSEVTAGDYGLLPFYKTANREQARLLSSCKENIFRLESRVKELETKLSRAVELLEHWQEAFANENYYSPITEDTKAFLSDLKGGRDEAK